MNETPLITICMAAYNAEEHISNAISSVLAQTYVNWELICVDDGSSDNTSDIVRSFIHVDDRIRLKRQNNAGPAQARRVAHLDGNGDYYISLDSDDRLKNDALELLVFDALASDADLTMADVRRFDENGKWKSFSFSRGIYPGQIMSGEEAFGLTFPWTSHGLFLAKREIILSSTGHENFFNNYNCDEYLTRVYLLKANKVIAGRGIYFYESNPTSITSDLTSRRLAFIQTNEKLLQLAIDSKVSPQILEKVFKEFESGLLIYCSLLGHHLSNGTLPVGQLWSSLQNLRRSESFFLKKQRKLPTSGAYPRVGIRNSLTRKTKFFYRFIRGYALQEPIFGRFKRMLRR